MCKVASASTKASARAGLPGAARAAPAARRSAAGPARCGAARRAGRPPPPGRCAARRRGRARRREPAVHHPGQFTGRHHVGARALPDVQQPVVRQRPYRLADGVAGHPELLDELRLGRDPGSHRPFAGRDLGAQLRDHLVGQRGPAGRGQRHGCAPGVGADGRRRGARRTLPVPGADRDSRGYRHRLDKHSSHDSMMAPMADDDLATLGPAAGPRTTPAPRPADGAGPPQPGPAEAAPEAHPATGPAGRWLPRIVIAGLVLAALNLRPAITSLGALLEEVRDGLGMSGTVAGLLTSVPALCFAAFGIAAPRLARRWGPGAIVCAGMAAIAVGVAVRPFAGGTGGFLAASALALAGIAVSNVLMPVVIKSWFPDRVGSMTGLYSMALALGTSLAAALTVPMTAALGGSWRTRPGGVGGARRGRRAALARRRTAADAGPPACPAGGRRGGRRRKPPCGSPRHRPPGRWPSSSASRPPPRTSRWAGCRRSSATPGVSAGTAGVLLAVTMAMGVPLSFVLPRLASRMRHQGPIAVVLGPLRPGRLRRAVAGTGRRRLGLGAADGHLQLRLPAGPDDDRDALDQLRRASSSSRPSRRASAI